MRRGPPVRRPVVAILALVLVVAAFAPRASASVPRPSYAVGDVWTYATNLTEELGLAFVGASRIEIARLGTTPVQGTSVDVAEALVTGGGSFTGTFEGIGTAVGTWSVTGTEAWETASWKSVRSFVRLSAQGSLQGGPSPIEFHLSVTNDTTRRTIADGWGWPIEDGGSGGWTAHWNVTQNITIEFTGGMPAWNASAFEGDVATDYVHIKSERVVVPAGAFEAHVIRERGPEGGSRVRWYAASAGNNVRNEDYNASGGRIATSELTSYVYATGAPLPGVPWLLLLNGALAASALVLLAALGVRRRRRRVDVWMPPEPGEAPRPPSP